MRYMIEEWDDLYCVYRWDRDFHGWRIVCACETETRAKEVIEKHEKEGAKHEKTY